RLYDRDPTRDEDPGSIRDRAGQLKFLLTSESVPSAKWCELLVRIRKLTACATFLNSNQWPIERYDQQQQERLDNRQPQPDAQHVVPVKVAIRITNDHYRRLIHKDFSAGSKRPDHTHR